MTIYFCQNYIEQKFKYIFLSDADEYKKYYFYCRYYNLALPLAEIDRINADCKKLNKKILEAEAKIFYFYHQRKLLLYCLRELGNCEIRNIKNIQKIKKKTKSHINPGLSVPDNLSFTVSEADCALAAVSKK